MSGCLFLGRRIPEGRFCFGVKKAGMGELRQQEYEDYIIRVSATAAAIGRREPYYLTYIRKYGSRIPKPEGRTQKRETKEGQE